MASEPRDGGLTSDLPEGLDDWLDDRADELGLPREEILAELVAGYQLAVEDGDAAALADVLDVEGSRDTLESELDQRLQDLERRRKETLDDVRKRVVQVKQTAESKAPADHGHEEFRRLEDLAASVEHLDRTVDELEETVASTPTEAPSIEAELADIREKLQMVAGAVIELRDAEGSNDDTRDALASLRTEAARKDVSRAQCAACGTGVDISLLEEAGCPQCEASFAGVEAASGFFGKPRLVGRTTNGEDEER